MLTSSVCKTSMVVKMVVKLCEKYPYFAVFTPYFVNYHPTTICTFSLEKYTKTKKKGRKR